MSDYTEMFLNRRADVKALELIEITHPDFSKPYRIVRNKIGGVTVTIDEEEVTFDYYPLAITPRGSRADLDYALQISLGDLGETVDAELEAVLAEDGMGTAPTVRYRMFSSDDLETPRRGPETLIVNEFPMTETGVSFLAKAPSLNANRTGENWTLDRVPMLAGLL